MYKILGKFESVDSQIYALFCKQVYSFNLLGTFFYINKFSSLTLLI